MAMIPAIMTGMMSLENISACARVLVGVEKVGQPRVVCADVHSQPFQYHVAIDVLLTIRSGLRTPMAEIPTPALAVP